jgi:hypothetical protein
MIYVTSDRNVVFSSSYVYQLNVLIQVHLVGLRSVIRIFYACGKLLKCVHLPAPNGNVCALLLLSVVEHVANFTYVWSEKAYYVF